MATPGSATTEDIARKFGHLSVQDLMHWILEVDAQRDFDNLLAAAPVLGMHRHGMKANEWLAGEEVYRAHRVLPHNGVHRPTLYQVWASPVLRDKLLCSVARLFGARGLHRIDKVHVLTAYKLQHGCIGLFRPMVAKYLYSTYSPRGRILDFCAGWGGRLLAALATPGVVSYVGIDTNSGMTAVYDAIIRRFGAREGAPAARVICAPAEAVDYSRLVPFDCVVTSPPYYGVEVYRDQPHYTNYEHWLSAFLLPTLRGITRYIDEDGTICINIRQPETERRMVAEMRHLGWAVRDTLLMRLPAMPGKGSHKATANYGEPIYVFCKSPPT